MKFNQEKAYQFAIKLLKKELPETFKNAIVVPLHDKGSIKEV